MATSLKVREERPMDFWGGNRFFSHMGTGMDRLFDDFFGGSLLRQIWPETRAHTLLESTSRRPRRR